MSEFTRYLGLSGDLADTVSHYEQRGSDPKAARINDHDIRRLVEWSYAEGRRVQKRRRDLFLIVVDAVLVAMGAAYLVTTAISLASGNWTSEVKLSDALLWLVWGLLVYLNFFVPQRANTKSLYELIRSRRTKASDVGSHREDVAAKGD